MDIKEINYIAKLAKLKFTEKEAKEFKVEFENILTHFKNIENEDLNETKEDFKEEIFSVVRKDEVFVFEDKKELFKNSKLTKDKYIEIPRVIE